MQQHSQGVYLTELSKINTNTLTPSSLTNNAFFKSKHTPSNSTARTFYKTKQSSFSVQNRSKPTSVSVHNDNNNNNNTTHNKKVKTNINTINLKHRNQTMHDTVTRLHHQSKTISKFKENFLDYIIHEKTQFADLSSIETHYSNLLISNYHKHNTNKLLIKHKKQQSHSLSQEMTKTLLEYFYPIENNELHKFEAQIAELKREIKKKEVEYNSYKHIYSRSYKTNYLLSKRYEDETAYAHIQHEQYEKYKILKEHAVNSVSKQSEMLVNMQKFQELSEMTYMNQLSQKTKLFNQLDFEVLMIKKDTASIETAIHVKIQQQNEMKKLIHQQCMINKKMYREHMGYVKEYHATNLKLLGIYRILKVKSLFNVIKQFNSLRKEYNLLHFRFEQVNYDIAKLNIQLTEMEKEIENVNEQIEIKRKGNFKCQDDAILAVSSKIQAQRYFNRLLEDSFKEKENLVKLMINFLNNNLAKVLKSLQESIMQNEFTIRAQIEKYQQIFSYDNEGEYNKSKNTCNSNNSNNSNTSQTFIELFKTFDKNIFIFVFNLFSDFIHDFFILISNVLNYVSLTDEMNKIEEDENNNNNNSGNITNTDSTYIHNKHSNIKQHQFQLILFKSPSFNVSVQHHISFAIKRQHDKAKILSRSEKDIFETKRLRTFLNQDSEHLKNQNIISGNKLYRKYLKYSKHYNNSFYDTKANQFATTHPKRSVSVMERYTNELVSDKIDKLKLQNERNAMIKQLSTIILNKQKTLELNRLLRIKKEKMDKIDKDEEEHDLDEDEYKNRTQIEFEKLSDELKKRQQKTKYKMLTPNPELNLIYMRLNDLRNLELNYYNDKDVVTSKGLNEMYYKFKKKYYPNGMKSNMSVSYTVKDKGKIGVSNKNKRNSENSQLLPYCAKDKRENVNKVNNVHRSSSQGSELVMSKTFNK